MKNLLRSCFLAQPSDSEALAAQNYHALIESGLGFDTPEDNIIWNYLQDFFKTYGHVPTLQTMRQHFTSIKETDVVERLERLQMLQPRTRGDFLTYLEDKAKDRRNRVALELFKEGAKIISTGVEIKGPRGKSTKLLGAIDAIRYVLDGSHNLVAPTLGSKLSGNLTQDGEDFKARYERVKADPKFGIGQYCGIRQIDEALQGAKRYELWIHAGFTGSMKSSYALHWAYVQAVYFGFSTVYFSLEMPYIQCRNIIYTMHTAHEDFAEVREKLGISGLGLEYEKIRDGKLAPNEEKFLFEYVVPDLGGRSTVPHDNPLSLKAEEYGSIHLEVADPDKTDFTIADLRSRAELIFSKTPFSMIMVDHAGLMSARGRYSSTTEKLNEVVRDLKRLAMSFNRGMGIAVVCLFQISREGYRAAEKNGGRYNLTHLSYANECVVGATPVLTDSGILPITQIIPGDRVWSRSGWKTVLHKFDQGIRPTWKVTTDRGSSLEATGNHRVRVLRKEDISWCPIEHLEPGDWILATRGDYPWATQAPVLPSLSNLNPRVLTDNLAYLLGAWDGDGQLRPNKISFTGNIKEKALQHRIKKAFKEVFGEDLLSYQFASRKSSFDVESVANKERTTWFEELAGKRGQEVPQAIFRAPKPLVVAYLKGLWDTDGWINNQGIVGLKMKSQSFLLQVQLLMTALGYETTLEQSRTHLKATNKGYAGWTLRLLGYGSRLRFLNEIGFTEPWKQQRLTDFVGTPPTTKQTNQVYPIPQIYLGLWEDYVPYHKITEGKINRSSYNAMRKVQQTGLVPYQALQTLISFLESEEIQDSRIEFIKHLLSLQVCQIQDVTPTGKQEPVYDLEVTGDHEFQTGSFLSHNCERSADIVTATWIDDTLRSMDKAIFQCLKSRDQAPFDRVPVTVRFPYRRLITDDTPIGELDIEVQQAKGGEDREQRQWRKHTDKGPDIDLT